VCAADNKRCRVRGGYKVSSPSSERPSGGRSSDQLYRSAVAEGNLIRELGDRAGTEHVDRESVCVDGENGGDSLVGAHRDGCGVHRATEVTGPASEGVASDRDGGEDGDRARRIRRSIGRPFDRAADRRRRSGRERIIIPEDATTTSTGVHDGGSEGIEGKGPDPRIGESCIHRGPGGATVRGAADAAITGAGIQDGGGKGIDGETEDPKIGESGIHCGPSGATIRGTKDATHGTSIQGGGGKGIDGKGPDPWIAEPSVCRRPGRAAIRGAEDATRGTSVQGGGGEGIDGKGADMLVGESSVHYSPGGAAIRGAEDATRGTSVQDGGSEGVDGKGADMRVGESSVYRRPHDPAIRGAEDAVTIGPGVQDGGSKGVDGKGPDPRIGESGVCRRPRSAAIRGAEDAVTTTTSIQGGRGDRVDGKTQKWTFVLRQSCPGSHICCPRCGGTCQYTRNTQDKAQNQRQDKTDGVFHSTACFRLFLCSQHYHTRARDNGQAFCLSGGWPPAIGVATVPSHDARLNRRSLAPASGPVVLLRQTLIAYWTQ